MTQQRRQENLRRADHDSDRARVGAFTIIEVLAVIAILAILIGIVIPALRSARSTGKSIVCSSNMKSVAMQFRFFVDGTGEQGRGDSRRLSADRFWINDFQDAMYRLDEFWDLGDAHTGMLRASEELMLCPAGAPQLEKRRGFPCGREAVRPAQDVSMAVNMRLYRAVFEVKGKRLLMSPLGTVLSPRILDQPYAPLVMDVDGREAIGKGVDPFYIAPPLRDASPDDPYSSGRYWSPSVRHGGKTIVGFVGGHVLRSAEPRNENWDWDYQGETRR